MSDEQWAQAVTGANRNLCIMVVGESPSLKHALTVAAMQDSTIQLCYLNSYNTAQSALKNKTIKPDIILGEYNGEGSMTAAHFLKPDYDMQSVASWLKRTKPQRIPFIGITVTDGQVTELQAKGAEMCFERSDFVKEITKNPQLLKEILEGLLNKEASVFTGRSGT